MGELNDVLDDILDRYDDDFDLDEALEKGGGPFEEWAEARGIDAPEFAHMMIDQAQKAIRTGMTLVEKGQDVKPYEVVVMAAGVAFQVGFEAAAARYAKAVPE